MKGRRRAFTLVELLIALVIAAIATIGIAAIYSSTRLESIEAECQRLAAWQAISKMEEIKARSSFDSLVSGSEQIVLKPLTVSATRTTTVTTLIDGKLKQVTVAVTWGGGRSVSLTSYVARRAL